MGTVLGAPGKDKGAYYGPANEGPEVQQTVRERRRAGKHRTTAKAWWNYLHTVSTGEVRRSGNQQGQFVFTYINNAVV
jgi:hypothetical protein